jgi:hypothetical protein
MSGELKRVGRRVAHKGNHRFLWAINKKLRKQIAVLAHTITDEAGMTTCTPYPKTLDAEAA